MMYHLVVALVFSIFLLLYWFIYSTRLVVGKKKGVIDFFCHRSIPRAASSIVLLLISYLFLLLNYHYYHWIIHTYYIFVLSLIVLIMVWHLLLFLFVDYVDML